MEAERSCCLPHTKATPFQLSLGSIFFSCCEKLVMLQRMTHRNCWEKKKSLRNIFIQPGGTLVWVGVKGSSLSKKTMVGIDFLLLAEVVSQMWGGYIYIEGSETSVPLNVPKGILCVHCVQRQDTQSVLSLLRLEMPAESQSRWCHIDVFATLLMENLI